MDPPAFRNNLKKLEKEQSKILQMINASAAKFQKESKELGY